MKDRVRALLLSLGVALVPLGWGLQQGAIQGRIAIDDTTQREYWFKGWSVLDPMRPSKGLESRFDLGTLLISIGAGLAVVSWRFPKPQ